MSERIERYVGGEMSEDDVGAFMRDVVGDARLREELAGAIVMHGMLRELGTTGQLSGAPRSGAVRPGRRQLARVTRFWPAAAAAVAAAVLAALWGLVQPGSTPVTTDSGRVEARVIATAADVGRNVIVVRAAGSDPILLGDGDVVRYGDRVETGDEGAALVCVDDATRVELASDASAALAGDAATRRFDIARGEVRAEIAPQVDGRAYVFMTPHAEARVLGTSLRLRVEEGTTRLDVRRGRVLFTGLEHGDAVEVSAGESADAGGPDGLVLRSTPTPRAAATVVDGFEGALAWEATRFSDPSTFVLVHDRAHAGTRSLRVEYRYRDPAGGGFGHTIIRRPLAASPEHARLSCWVFVEEADDAAQINMNCVLDDGGAWFMGYRLLSRSPRGEWFVFSVPVREAVKKNSRTGGDVYDHTRIRSCSFSVFGGSATLYVDDLALSE